VYRGGRHKDTPQGKKERKKNILFRFVSLSDRSVGERVRQICLMDAGSLFFLFFSWFFTVSIPAVGQSISFCGTHLTIGKKRKKKPRRQRPCLHHKNKYNHIPFLSFICYLIDTFKFVYSSISLAPLYRRFLGGRLLGR
jgi:amino acid transporter